MALVPGSPSPGLISTAPLIWLAIERTSRWPSPLVAQAEPDRHTLLIAQTAEVAIDPAENRTVNFDPRWDLQPIALVGIAPIAVSVPASSSWTTMSELLAASRFSNQGLSAVSAEPKTPEAMAQDMLRLRTPIRFASRAAGGGGSLEDLLIGRADVCLCGLPEVLPHVASGAVRIIAVSSPARSLILPHVPTLREELRNDRVEVTRWIGVFASRDTPSAVAAQLNLEINRLLGQPEVREQLLSRGLDLMPMPVDRFARFVDMERRKYADLRREVFCAKAPPAGCSIGRLLP